MTKVSLDCGVNLEIDETKMDDMEFLEVLTDMEGGDACAGIKILRMILPNDKIAELKTKMKKNEAGKVTTETLFLTIKEIFEKAGNETKNS